MAKPSTTRKEIPGGDIPARAGVFFRWRMLGVPLLLAIAAFGLYGPSLKSGFVYDAGFEILKEGFITSLSNLPAVLSLKVLGMHLSLGPRPGQLLYLMLVAAVGGREPFGFHLGSNLLHAANVALLFVLLRRLIAREMTDSSGNAFQVQLAAAAATLIFAVHPVAVESVAEVSYSSSLLVTLFTLLGLLAATAFRPGNLRGAWLAGGAGVLCSFAAVASKESGVAVAPLLIVYWFLFRRTEPRAPWLWFLGAATAVTVAFVAARFLCEPSDHLQIDFLGGSFFQVFLIQPRLWVFMMGKLVWPTQLSADYMPENLAWLSPPITFTLLVVVVALQGWLAWRSRIGALGVAIYWLGLAAVSNFFPLALPVADRFYYLPLAGVALQLLALLSMALKSRRVFWTALALLFLAMAPLTTLTLAREKVFADDFSLWGDTLRVSPSSSRADNNFGFSLFQRGRTDEALALYRKALKINPDYSDALYNLGNALVQTGRIDEAIVQFQKAMKLNPRDAEAYNNLGVALFKKGKMDEAIALFQKALTLDFHNADARANLDVAVAQKRQLDEAINQCQKALKTNPRDTKTYINLGAFYFQKGQVDEAIVQFQKALAIDPHFAAARNNLGAAFLQKGQLTEAIVQFQEALKLKPGYARAQNNLAQAEALQQQQTGRKFLEK